jgi:exodeoxyribonuclease X
VEVVTATNPCYTIDFETTDKDPKLAKPVEVAVYNPNWEYETLIYCDGIPCETTAIHHITDFDVQHSPSWDAVKGNLAGYFSGSPIPVLVAHNAEYEKTVLGDFTPVLWVCTYKCALRVWPDAPAHRNEVLRYHLKLGPQEFSGRRAKQSTHSAMHDARVTWWLFEELLKYTTLAQLIEWTEQPAKLPKIPMGKHYGQTWDTIPGQYLTWLTQQKDMREDVKHCAQAELTRRRKGGAT